MVNPWTAWSAIEAAKLRWCSPMKTSLGRPVLFIIGKANQSMTQTQRQCPKNKRDADYQGYVASLRSPWNPVGSFFPFRLSAVWNVDDAFASYLHLYGLFIWQQQKKPIKNGFLAISLRPNLHVSADFCGLAKSENCPYCPVLTRLVYPEQKGQ